MNDKKEDTILEFIKDPYHYLYEKIKKKGNKKFNDIMNDEIINILIDIFNSNIKSLCDNLESKINESNQKFFNNEFQLILDEYNKKIENKFKNLCDINSKHISTIKVIISKRGIGGITNK